MMNTLLYYIFNGISIFIGLIVSKRIIDFFKKNDKQYSLIELGYIYLSTDFISSIVLYIMYKTIF